MSSNVVQHPQVLAFADLKRSGLTSKDAKKLKLEVLTSDQTFDITSKFRVRSVRFPYHDMRGKDTGFFRLRFLDDPRGFGAGHAAKKPQRYWQPPDTVPQLYLPPCMNWLPIFADERAEIWITEGEKKAAAACKAGIPCVGLGGVWSWRSKKSRMPLIPDMATISWKRPIVLCFDTDAEPNPLVLGALEMLGYTLSTKGASVQVLTLPLEEGADKTGLDDFLVAHGAVKLKTLNRKGLASEAELIRLNDELAVIENPVSILHIPTRQLFIKPQALTQMKFANRAVPSIDAAGRMGETNAVTAWLKWNGRRQYAGIAYEPGEPLGLEDGRFNLWRGWPYRPKKGDVSLFTKLFDYAFGALKPKEYSWLLQWMAYPIQYPGAKLYTALVLWGQGQGIGKSLIGYTLGQLYGENAFAVITEHELHGQFNDWAAGKSLVLGEEITGSERRSEANRLKHIITGETIRVNTKFQPPYVLRSCANFIFTTNDHDAFLLDTYDRRFFVVEVGRNRERPSERWFVKTYNDWFKSESGAAALHYYLSKVNLTDFDPRSRAPMTVAKVEMAAASGTEADILVREVLAAPDAFIRVGGEPVPRDLFTLGELLNILDPDMRYGLKLRALGAALRRAGVEVCEPTQTAAGTVRLWPIRNARHWNTKADHAARVAHYNGVKTPTDKKPKF